MSEEHKRKQEQEKRKREQEQINEIQRLREEQIKKEQIELEQLKLRQQQKTLEQIERAKIIQEHPEAKQLRDYGQGEKIYEPENNEYKTHKSTRQKNKVVFFSQSRITSLVFAHIGFIISYQSLNIVYRNIALSQKLPEVKNLPLFSEVSLSIYLIYLFFGLIDSKNSIFIAILCIVFPALGA